MYLDVENYIDYLITNVYARNGDWPIRNYYMSRRIGPDSTGFQFYVWDAEFTLDRGTTASITEVSSDGPGIVYQLLKNSEAFRVQFSDRVQQHFSEGGAYYVDSENADYDPENPQDNVPATLYLDVANEVASPIVAETARWGDERGRNGPVFTRDDEWMPLINFNLGTFFPNRSRDFLADLRRNGLYRDAPAFSVPGGSIEAGQSVQLTAGSGVVYYTLDGTDPRNPDGSISATAILGNTLVIEQRTTLRTRSLDGNEWSAIDVAEYFTDTVPAAATNLRISELNYNPHDALPTFGELDVNNDEFEFVELVNIADRPVDLTGVQFVQLGGEGIAFEFGAQVLAPNERMAVVKNRDAFVSRFGGDVLLAQGTGDDASQWFYEGQLSNGGELVSLIDSQGDAIAELRYDDSGDWPGRADGNGSSLEAIDLLAIAIDPSNYRSSSEIGGSPGATGSGSDNRVVINEILANSDGLAVDQIELLNTTNEEIDLSGWYLTDSSNDFTQYRIPNDVRISGQGYLVFDGNELTFGLSGVRGDDVYLIASDLDGKPVRFVDRVEFGATDVGVTLGRWPNAQGRLFPMASASFGEENSGPLAAPIVVSEIHYEPQDPDDNGPLTESDFEYVELYNQTDETVDLGAYSLDGSVELTFPPELQLASGASIVAVKFDPLLEPSRGQLFRIAYGIDESVRLVGPLLGELGNESGVVRVERATVDGIDDPDRSQVLVDRVAYVNSADWPRDLNGSGQALTRLSPTAYGDFATSWTSLRRSPGLTDFSDRSPGDVNGDGLVDVDDIDQLCAAIHGDTEERRFDLNRDGQIDLSDYRRLIGDILGVDPGDANLDGVFNSSDFVLVFRAAEYEDDVASNSTWAEGDWNCDGEFNTTDFVVAFQAGGYSSFDAPARRTTAFPTTFFQVEQEDHEPVDLAPSRTPVAVVPAVDPFRHSFGQHANIKPIFDRQSLPTGKIGILPLAVDRFFEGDDSAGS